MTYHSFDAAGTQTVVPPTGFGVPPYGTPAVVSPAGTGHWTGTGPAMPPSDGNRANRYNWVIIVGVAAVVAVAAIVSILALKPGPTPHASPVVTNPASGSAGASQPTSSQSSSQSTPPPQSSTQQSSTQQSSTQQPAPDSAAASEQYLYDLNSQGGDFLSVSDADLLTYGNAVCGDFEAGNTVQQTVDDAASAADGNPDGLTQSDLGTIIGVATATLCPSYGPEVQAWAQANS